MDYKKQIIVVEDEPSIAEVLQFNLTREGFEVEVFHRGDEALSSIETHLPDLLILDLMLPGIDGLELCRRLKRDPKTQNIPVVMLTARAEEIDRIVGLELGVDDYIGKPFSPREVVLRVKAVLRRGEPVDESASGGEVFTLGNLKLDIEGHRFFIGEREVVLTATEFRLLEALMRRPGYVRSRGQLLSEVWGYSEDVDSRTVDTHIRRLRKKMAAESSRIETLIGVGYRMVSRQKS